MRQLGALDTVLTLGSKLGEMACGLDTRDQYILAENGDYATKQQLTRACSCMREEGSHTLCGLRKVVTLCMVGERWKVVTLCGVGGR